MTSIGLSPHQQLAAEAIQLWWREHLDNSSAKRPFFYLAGYAGTGKTSIAKTLVEQLVAPERDDESGKGGEGGEGGEEYEDEHLRFAFAAFTGKASLGLSRKGCRSSSTIHRLIYQRVWDATKKSHIFIKRSILDKALDLIILDECSMVNVEMGTDLLSYQVPILVLGDPGQLPPVEGAGFFTSHMPDFMLTEIHRQASESPILRIATAAREGIPILNGVYRSEQSAVSILSAQAPLSTILQADQILCGTNKLRTKLNAMIRENSNYIGLFPNVGEKLICLKNNWSVDSMMNGSLWRVISLTPSIDKRYPLRLTLSLEDWDNPDLKVTVNTHQSCFDLAVTPPKYEHEWKDMTQFTYGYAITVHKSQGSEWNDILLYNEATKFRLDANKWLYTAITRASRNLIICN